MIQNPRFWTKSLPGGPLRKNLEFLNTIFGTEDLFKFNWKFITFSTQGAVTDFQISHNANFVPTDVLSTRSEGGITFNYGLFTDKFLYVTTTGAATFRGLLGRYRENME